MKWALAALAWALPAVAAAQPTALELSVGASSMARRLSFAGDSADALGGYHLLAAPAARAEARWFPARHWTDHPLAGVGGYARARGALTFESESGQGDETTRYATTVDDFELGVAYRASIDPVRLEVALGYGESRYRVEPAGPTTPTSPRPAFPSVRYRFVRPALGARVALPEGFSIAGRVGWRGVIDAGPLGAAPWFARSFTTGVDLSLAVGWRFDRWFEVRVRAEHARWMTALNVEPGDPVQAESALDEQTWIGAELAFVLPGASS